MKFSAPTSLIKSIASTETDCISWEYQVALFGKMPSKYKKGKMDPKMVQWDFGPPE